MNIKIILPFLCFISMINPCYSLADKKAQKVKLNRAHLKKIERIANFFALELNKRKIKEIDVQDITDIKGQKLELGTSISNKLRDILSKKGFKINKNAMIKIFGTMINYKEKSERWKVDVKIKTLKGEIIISYSAIFDFEKL